MEVQTCLVELCIIETKEMLGKEDLKTHPARFLKWKIARKAEQTRFPSDDTS